MEHCKELGGAGPASVDESYLPPYLRQEESKRLDGEIAFKLPLRRSVCRDCADRVVNPLYRSGDGSIHNPLPGFNR